MASPKINNERISQMSVEKLVTLSKSRPKNKAKVIKELQRRNLNPSDILNKNEEV